jgi:oligopeptide/dipeptide ABC transporter ATP-binding protein
VTAGVLLHVDRLTTVFEMGTKTIRAVDEVSFDVGRGETLGLVGESGSGKSVTALSILRLVQAPGRIAGGAVELGGRDLTALGEAEMRKVRGAEISMIFQEPMTALNPVMTVGDQVAESLVVHDLMPWSEARRRAVELMEAVRIPDPGRRARDYPHQLSGGMRQRVMIAIALACKPSLVIADEPTTALDVTIQAEILELLRDMKAEFDLALLLITHDLGVIAETADRVAVMYAGRIVEQGGVRQIFREPRHPYTRGLLASIPGGRAGDRLKAIKGTVPALAALPRGCAFAPRCPEQFDTCLTSPPPDVALDAAHRVRCYLYPPEPAG